jgi:L-aspartate oxidase
VGVGDQARPDAPVHGGALVRAGAQADAGAQVRGGHQARGGGQARDGLAREHGNEERAYRSGPGACAVTEPGGAHEFTRSGEGADAADGRAALAQAMSRYAGVMRDGDGLTRLLEVIAKTGSGPCSLAAPGGANSPDACDRDLDFDLESVEAANLRAVSLLIAVGARRRAESRGCHRRWDVTDTATAPWHTLVRWDGHKLVVTKEAM